VTTFGERLSRDVCFGSKADMVPADWHVRFTLKSGHRAEINQSSVLTAGVQASTSIPGPRAHEFKVGRKWGRRVWEAALSPINQRLSCNSGFKTGDK